MSELKVYHCNEWHNEYTEFYMKSEADKVIAELEADKLELKQRLNVLDGKLFGLSQSYNIKISMCGCLERKIKEKDKVIADLEEKHKTEVKELLCLIRDIENNFNRAFDSEEKELRRHKYKRCLAMARWCEERYNYLTCLENWQMTDKEYQQVIGDYWDRWHKRWLKIAEQFKEGV